jgi:hypothetical protein
MAQARPVNDGGLAERSPNRIAKPLAITAGAADRDGKLIPRPELSAQQPDCRVNEAWARV